MTHLISDSVDKIDRLCKAVGKAHNDFVIEYGRYPTLMELAIDAYYSEYLTKYAVKELRLELLSFVEIDNGSVN